MKIVYWGTPKYSADNLISIVNAGYEVIAVITQPDRRRSRGNKLTPSAVKQASLDLGIPVYTTHSIGKDKNTKDLLFNLNADVYVVVAFGQILPKDILEKPKLGCWNSHASLLPVWRGAAPIQWSIINDDAKTGVCIMSMEEGLDTGPVINQETIPINDTDNLEVLTNKLSLLSSKLLVQSLFKIKYTKTFSKIERLEYLNAVDQSQLTGIPSYARQIIKDDYLLDWNQNARQVLKKVNGLYPNSYTIHNGKRIKILDISLLNNNNNNNNNNFIENMQDVYILSKKKSPGEILLIDNKHGIVIMTNDYPILVRSGQLEGKKRTDGYTLSIQSGINANNCILS